MTLPVMATQVDTLGSGSFRAFRPWRRREASPAQMSQGDGSTSSSYRASASSRDITSALRQATPTGTPLSSSSLSPSPPSTRSASGRRSRTRLSVSAPTLSVSPSSSPPSYLYSYSSDPQIAPRPGPGFAYTYNHTARPATNSLSDDADPDGLGPPEESQHTLPDDAPVPPSMQTKPASSGTDKSAQSTAKPGRQPAPRAQSDGGGRPSLKRRRALSDVDGPNTAALCCKKRRLRRVLITSRLSQPFSQPASHILNRESVASGDKRFLKLAAIMNARRLRTPQSAAGVPPPPEVVWRAAMANRFRKRIFADTAMGRSIAGAPTQLMNRARLTLVPVATAASMAAVRASGVPGVHPVPAAHIKSPLASAPPVAQSVLLPPAHKTFVRPTSPLGAGGSGGGNSSSSSSAGRSHSRSPRQRSVRGRTSVCDNRHRPVEEDYPRPSLVDDEGDCAFPMTEHESRYEVNDYDDEDDRPDDEVYADFSVLFGSSGDDTVWGSGDEEGLDDCMDELDGIAHLPR